METCRAIRYLRPDPVPDELIERVIYAATRAPSGRNSQAWSFVVVRDRGTKQQLSHVFLPPLVAQWDETVNPHPETPLIMRRGVLNLARNLPDVPVVIFVTGPRSSLDGVARSEQVLWAGVYPAVQNLIVAARSIGIGTTFTMFHILGEARVREILNIPDDTPIAATIPMGWPARPFGPVRRRPVSEVIHWEQWGHQRVGP
jgi:nitroreductase